MVSRISIRRRSSGSTSNVDLLTIFDGSGGHKDDTRIIYVMKDDDPDEIDSSPII